MKYRVPRGDRESAAWPPVRDMPGLVRGNLRLNTGRRPDVLGMPYADFAFACRGELLDAARTYASDMGLPFPATVSGPIVATGHQPEFYHAGVWIKNHLAFRLARFLAGTSLNLVVDNDVPRHLGLLLPDVGADSARQVLAPLGEPRADVAYEECLSERADTETFARVAAGSAAGTPFEASAGELIGRITAALGAGGSAADLNVRVRASYEREAGIANVELPVSRLCDTAAFGAFVAHICLNAGAFAFAHNQALADYRRERHIRYAVNPVPDLATGVVCEVPFWIWRKGQGRRRMFVAADGTRVKVFADGAEIFAGEIRGRDDVPRFLGSLRERGLKVRPRAVSLTLFARLFACDAFVHGIGGATYDEVTDRIARAFFGLEPPAYAVITATMLIPWPFDHVDWEERRRLIRELRDIRHNPDRLVSPVDKESRALIAGKKAAVASSPSTPDARRAKWTEVRAINGLLAGRLASREADVRLRLAELGRGSERDRVAFGREYSCFLIGAQRVTAFYRDVLAPLMVDPG